MRGEIFIDLDPAASSDAWFFLVRGAGYPTAMR
jgi:hypothetical protein